MALEDWPRNGLPANPRTWLVSTGRFKAIDSLRRRSRFVTSVDDISEKLISDGVDDSEAGDQDIPDDRLQLIFTCCHPSLPPEARVALTLREVCGLTTEAIAHAFLTNPPTLAQRIVRAKQKIRDEAIPYQVPVLEELPARLESVLQVIYLVFNEGYAVSSGDALTRPDLSGEAIRLGQLLVDFLPEPEAIGLLALMLLHESRRLARSTTYGDLILLADQDRSLWNRDMISAGLNMVERAMSAPTFGPYSLQAAIAALHAVAPSFVDTDWNQIIELYDLLFQYYSSPVVEINRAAAISMRDGPSAGLMLIDEILARGDLVNYHLAYSARADLYRRLGMMAEARTAYNRALELARQEPERRFILSRLSALESDP